MGKRIMGKVIKGRQMVKEGVRSSNCKTLVIGGIICGVTVFIGTIISSFMIVLKVVKPKTYAYDDLYLEEIKLGRFKESSFHKMTKEQVQLKSNYGYDINGYFFPGENKNKSIILLHGITCSLWTSMKYVEIFMKKGYNVFIYDHRNHGRSGGNFTTLGVLERYDTKVAVDYVKNRCGENSVVGLYGESMGAGTAMLALGIDPRIDFLIEDCGYSDIKKQLEVRLKDEYKLPSFPFLLISRIIVKLWLKVDLFQESPVEVMKKCNVPVLFIHGDNDKYVPTFMVHELYDAKRNNKELHIFKDTKHAASYVNHKEEYEQVIYRFLEFYGF